MLGALAQRYPAAHYVVIDDKLRILTAVKRLWSGRVTTVFVRQGHYALDAREVQRYPAADLTLAHIREVASLSRAMLP
jgi:hypothetical protein